MSEFFDRLRPHFPNAELRDGALILRERTGRGGAYVRLLAQSGARANLKLVAVFPLSESTTESRRAAFNHAVGGLLEEHWGLQLHSMAEGGMLSLAAETPVEDADERWVLRHINPIGLAFPHLEVLLEELENGSEPFEALGRRGAAAASGEIPQPAPQPNFVPTKALRSQPSGDLSQLPNLDTLEDEIEWLHKRLDRTLAAHAIGVLHTHDGEKEGPVMLLITLGLREKPDIRWLEAAVREAIEHRLDLRSEVISLHSPIGSAMQTIVNLRVIGEEGVTSKAAIAGLLSFLDQWVEFIEHGLPLADVLGVSPQTPVTPVSAVNGSPLASRGGPRYEAPAPKKPEPEPLPLGALFDLHLVHAGYNTRHMQQVLSLLLSVDVLQAAELCEAVPCLLLPELTLERAEDLRRLIAKAGGKAELKPLKT